MQFCPSLHLGNDTVHAIITDNLCADAPTQIYFQSRYPEMVSDLVRARRRFTTIVGNVFSRHEAFAMEKKDVSTSQESSRVKFVSPVLDSSRFVEVCQGRVTV